VTSLVLVWLHLSRANLRSHLREAHGFNLDITKVNPKSTVSSIKKKV